VSLTIPHPPLVGGVSQQSDGVRLENQVIRQDNAWSSLVDGLTKRQPTEHIARAMLWVPAAPPDVYVHWIYRDSTEKYAVLVFDQSLRVFDLAGTEYGIYTAFEGGSGVLQTDFSYLTFTQGVKPRMVTIADTTFVVNPEIPVEINTSFQNENYLENTDRRAHIFVKSGQYDSRYKVVIGVTPTSPPGPEVQSTIIAQTYEGDPGSGWNDDEIGSIRTNKIAEELALGTAAKVQQHTGLNGLANVTATQFDSLIRIEVDATYEITTLEVTDSSGDTLISGWKKEIERVTDLPTYAIDGQVVKVVGTSDDPADDYFVKHVRDGDGPGRWEETLDPAVEQSLDVTTMPWWLVRKQDDGAGTVTGTPNQIYFSFDYEPVTGGINTGWAVRSVGDDDTNPFPSFVTEDIADTSTHRKIEDIFFWQNRLGFLSDQNVILSEAGVYENFFRTSVRDLLDGDPIDVTVGHQQVHNLHSAVPADDELYLFSRTTQFVLKGEGVLSNRTVSIEPRLAFENLPVRPVSSGRGAFFPYTTGAFSKVRELIRISDETWDAADVTIQVPKYIEGTVTRLEASEVQGLLAVAADADPGALYLYRYFWNGNQKVQSAWFRYLFGDDAYVLGHGFFDNELYLVVKRARGIFIEKLDLEERNQDASSTWVLNLDRRITESGLSRVYTAGSNSTEITLPYDLDTGEVPWVTTRPAGAVLPVVATDTGTPDAHTVTVSGDHSADTLWLGVEYLMDVELPKPTLRATNRQGFASVVRQPVKVPRGHIAYRDSSAFVVRSYADQSLLNDDVFSSFVVGQTPVGTVALETGVFPFSVWGDAKDVVVSLRNNTPHPSNFNELEWETKTSKQTSRWRG
jgi:hypothetical protein